MGRRRQAGAGLEQSEGRHHIYYSSGRAGERRDEVVRAGREDDPLLGPPLVPRQRGPNGLPVQLGVAVPPQRSGPLQRAGLEHVREVLERLVLVELRAMRSPWGEHVPVAQEKRSCITRASP